MRIGRATRDVRLTSEAVVSPPTAGPQLREPADFHDGTTTPDLYARTYMTLLRSSGTVRVHALEAAHARMRSSLHSLAAHPEPDAGALIYATQRLPLCIRDVSSVVIGQEGEQFRAVLGSDVEHWERVEAAARRRAWRWDGRRTLTVHASSPSDLDDVVPCLVAYQIEWNKLHAALAQVMGPDWSDTAAGSDWSDAVSGELPSPALMNSGSGSSEVVEVVSEDRTFVPADVTALGDRLGFGATDWARLARIHGSSFPTWLRQVARSPKDVSLRLLGGNDVAYTRLARRWWRPITATSIGSSIDHRPVYFVSSNLHSIANLVSGYVRRRRNILLDFLHDAAPPGIAGEEVEALRSLEPVANLENILYYASRLWHQAHRAQALRDVRRAEEEERGITQVDATTGFDVGAQVIDLSNVRPDDLDPRLARYAQVAERSDAVILNVDYPLGLASYHIVREVMTSCADVRGVYAIGKAATLNAAVGDVLLSDTVYDEHSGNSYAFPNAFRAQHLSAFLTFASALDNQTAVTVRGTFLQNHASLGRYYGERFTVVEMEAGPILSAVYEATRPDRHPSGERIYFRELPMDFGIIHYASDTPYTQARTLGSRGLSVEGIDATYAASLAVLERILVSEGKRVGV